MCAQGVGMHSVLLQDGGPGIKLTALGLAGSVSEAGQEPKPLPMLPEAMVRN